MGRNIFDGNGMLGGGSTELSFPNYNGGIGNLFTGNAQRPLGLMNPFGNQVDRDAARLVAASAVHEQCRMTLAKSALENVGKLSALESQLCRVAPYGERRYSTIVDAYAMGAAARLMRW